MKYLKKISLAFIITIISILVLTFIVSFLSYFDGIKDKYISIFKIIIPIISILIGAIYVGLKSNKKGYIEGIKYGLIYSFIMISFNYIAFNNFKTQYFIYYIILIITSTVGSMIGILKKK